MSVFEHWENRKQSLREALAEQGDMAGVIYQVRHALLQTEQNALADMADDVLRQQAGVLLSGLKTSVGLLDAHITTQVWVPESQRNEKTKHGKIAGWTLPLLIQSALGIYCYFKSFILGWVLALAALLCAFGAAFIRRKKPEADPDEVRVTLKPDPDSLFALLDGQIRAVDRALNDFSYLNEQLRGGAECTDSAMLSCAADLLEALYEYDAAAESPAREAAERMLKSMGLCALDYSEPNRRLFNALPSKTETRTLSPAIVSLQDRKLLRRGTAAVRVDAA